MKKKNTTKNKKINYVSIIIQNLIVFVFLIILTESFSYSILYFYKKKISNKVSEIDKTYKSNLSKNISISNPMYSSEEVKLKLRQATANEREYYEYFAHLVYKNKKFVSPYLNIDEHGIRKNSKNPYQINDLKKKKIWFSGSSSIFGLTNADFQTVPAYLEQMLQTTAKNFDFKVLNLGVVGYTSIQEFINIRFRQLQFNDTPDILIVMNGVNDYHNSWLSRKSDIKNLLKTGINSDVVLSHYWSIHNKKKIFNTQNILLYFNYTFSNSIELINKAKKYFILNNANLDKEKFWKHYKNKKNKASELAKINLEINTRNYIGNMEIIANFAKSQNIKVLFILQPILYEAEQIKNLVAQEVTEYIHSQTGFFAKSNSDIKYTDDVTSELIGSKYYWDLNQYIDNYKKLRVELTNLCKRLEVDCLDINEIIKNNKNQPIFSSPFHYTYIGAEIFAQGIKNRLINNSYFKLKN